MEYRTVDFFRVVDAARQDGLQRAHLKYCSLDQVKALLHKMGNPCFAWLTQAEASGYDEPDELEIYEDRDGEMVPMMVKYINVYIVDLV